MALNAPGTGKTFDDFQAFGYASPFGDSGVCGGLVRNGAKADATSPGGLREQARPSMGMACFRFLEGVRDVAKQVVEDPVSLGDLGDHRCSGVWC